MLFKIDKWWVYKMAGAWLTFGLFSAWHDVPLTLNNYGQFGTLLLLLSLLAVLGHALNDYYDYSIDRAAGKTNIRNSIGTGNTRIFLSFLLVVSALIAVFFNQPRLMALWIIQILLNVAYSAPPWRLKERGLASTLVTGFYERVVPYLMVHEVLLNKTSADNWEISGLVTTYLLWSYLWECRNHLRGQEVDRESDIASGVRTLSALAASSQVLKLTRIMFTIEIALLSAWVCHSKYTMIGLGLSAITLAFAKLLPEKSTVNKVMWYTDMLYVHAFPQMLLLSLSFYTVTLIPLFITACLFFKNAFVIALDNMADYASNKILGGVSFFVNHGIYHFRRNVLRWSEERSRARGNSWLWK